MTQTMEDKMQYLPAATRKALEEQAKALGLDSLTGDPSTAPTTAPAPVSVPEQDDPDFIANPNPDVYVGNRPLDSVSSQIDGLSTRTTPTAMPDPQPVPAPQPSAQEGAAAQLEQERRLREEAERRAEAAERARAIAEQLSKSDRGRLKDQTTLEKTLAQLQQQNALMQQQIELMRTQPQQAQAPSVPPGTGEIPRGERLREALGWTEELWDQLGEESAIASYVASQRSQAVIQAEFEKFQRQQMQAQQQTAHQQFLASLSSRVPEWQALEQHEWWTPFLETANEYGESFYDILARAHSRGDATAASTVFQKFRDTLQYQQVAPGAKPQSGAQYQMPRASGGGIPPQQSGPGMTVEQYMAEALALTKKGLSTADYLAAKQKIDAQARAAGIL